MYIHAITDKLENDWDIRVRAMGSVSDIPDVVDGTYMQQIWEEFCQKAKDLPHIEGIKNLWQRIEDGTSADRTKPQRLRHTKMSQLECGMMLASDAIMELDLATGLIKVDIHTTKLRPGWWPDHG